MHVKMMMIFTLLKVARNSAVEADLLSEKNTMFNDQKVNQHLSKFKLHLDQRFFPQWWRYLCPCEYRNKVDEVKMGC